MKRSLLILVSLFAFSDLFAQTADLKVGYDYHFFDPRGTITGVSLYSSNNNIDKISLAFI